MHLDFCNPTTIQRNSPFKKKLLLLLLDLKAHSLAKKKMQVLTLLMAVDADNLAEWHNQGVIPVDAENW